MRAENEAVATMHAHIVSAFKQVYWPEEIAKGEDMPQYFDAIAQLFAIRKIREAQARGVNVEEAVNNGNIEVVNDGTTVKVVLRHNAQAQTQTDTQAASDTQQTTDNTTAPTAENAETQTTEESSTVQNEPTPRRTVNVRDIFWEAADDTAEKRIAKEALDASNGDVSAAWSALHDREQSMPRNTREDRAASSEIRRARDILNDLQKVEKWADGVKQDLENGTRTLQQFLDYYREGVIFYEENLTELENDPDADPVLLIKAKKNLAEARRSLAYLEAMGKSDTQAAPEAQNEGQTATEDGDQTNAVSDSSITAKIADVATKIKKLRDAKENGIVLAEFEQTGWHGSAFMFDRFSPDFIGTGDGHDVLGWGVNFTTSQNRADRYRKSVVQEPRVTIFIDGKQIRQFDDGLSGIAQKAFDFILARHLDKNGAVAKLQASIDRYKQMIETADASDREFYQSLVDENTEILKFINDHVETSEIAPNGVTYEVDIPDNEVLLDFAKRLDEQHSGVRQQISLLGKQLGVSFRDSVTGREIYASLTDRLGSKQKASEALRNAGVYGNRLVVDEEQSDVVIFDSNDVEILSRNGEKMPWVKKLATHKAAWVRWLKHYDDPKASVRGGFKIMDTPLVMQLINAPALPLKITGRIIDKLIDKHHISKKELEKLPEALADPLMILDSKGDNVSDIMAVVNMETTEGATVMIGIRFHKHGDAMVANGVSTGYGKYHSVLKRPEYGWYIKEIENGALRYIDQTKEETAKLLGRGLTEHPSGNSFQSLLNAPNVKQKRDLVKLRAQNNFELYQSARGKSTFTSEETIISVFEGGDKSTMIHELGHVFLQELSQFAKMANADPMFADEWKAISEWLGVSDLDPNDLKTEEEAKRWKNAQEQFAATFEAYLMEGNAPTPELQSVFRRFKQWLMDVYNSVRNIVWKDADGGLHHVEINDEIRGFFDRLFASRQAIEEQQAISRAEASVQTFAQALEKAGASAGSIENIRARARESRYSARQDIAKSLHGASRCTRRILPTPLSKS